MSALLFADDALHLGESGERLQKLVNEFDVASKKINLRGSVRKSEVIVLKENSVMHCRISISEQQWKKILRILSTL